MGTFAPIIVVLHEITKDFFKFLIDITQGSPTKD
jgi:hypothetical protein